MLDWLRRLLHRPTPRTAAIVLYTRQGCHLCDDARAAIDAVGRRFPIQLSVVDVDDDPELADEYGQSVPVVRVNGKIRFRGRVNEVLLARLLAVETRG